jgi:hypothetical protein
MSTPEATLEKLFQDQPLDAEEKTILRAAFDGSTLRINWAVVEYSVEQVSLDTEDDDEAMGYRLNTARKDASRDYSWTLPDGAAEALAALKLEEMSAHEGIWYDDLSDGHPVMDEYSSLSDAYPESQLPEGWDDEGYGEGYGDYGTLYTSEGAEWSGGYEPIEEEICLYHRKGSGTSGGPLPPDIWCSQEPNDLSLEQAELLLTVLAEST